MSWICGKCHRANYKKGACVFCGESTRNHPES